MLYFKSLFINLILYLFLCLVSSCSNGVHQEESPKFYFDVKGYFDSEADRLSKQQIELKKTAEFDKVSKSKTFTNPDWQTEFSLFSSSDINKSSWSKSYRIEQSDTLLTYTALEEKLRTREVKIHLKDSLNVVAISIKNFIKNDLYELSENLEYYPSGSYKIERTQKPTLLSESIIFIKGEF